MGVLMYTGEHRVYVPGFVVSGMLGELPGVRGDFGFGSLDAAANVPQTYFSYGQHFDTWDGYLPHPDHHRFVSFPGDRVTAFIEAALELDFDQEPNGRVWTRRAVDAVKVMEQVVRSPEEIEVVVFKAPFEEWAKDDTTLPIFTGWVHQFLNAYDYDEREPWHVLRDDFNDDGADPDDLHGTMVRIGYCPMPIFVIEESVKGRDKRGLPVLERQITAVKTYTPEGATQVLNRFRLAEQMRVDRLLIEAGATDIERASILKYADRGTVQRDGEVRSWLELCRNPPIERWERIRRTGEAILDAAAGLRPIRWLERQLSLIKEKTRDF